jgi:hypothetical protein
VVTGSPAAVLIIGVAVPGVPWLLSAGRAEKHAIARLEAAEAWTRPADLPSPPSPQAQAGNP